MHPSEAASPGAVDIGRTQREAEPFLERKGAVICKGGDSFQPLPRPPCGLGAGECEDQGKKMAP